MPVPAGGPGPVPAARPSEELGGPAPARDPEAALAHAGTVLAEVGRDPRRALALADDLIRETDPGAPDERRGSGRYAAARAVAHRAAALALREIGDLAAAERRARAAVREAADAGPRWRRRRPAGRADPEPPTADSAAPPPGDRVAPPPGDPAAQPPPCDPAEEAPDQGVQAGAEARMTLAFILLDRGRSRAALAQADRAAATLRGLPATRLAGQRALILQRTGRLDEALAAYAEVIPTLRRAGDALWEARARNNRGLLYGHRGDLRAAEADLVRASQLYAELGMDRFAADAQWNLATVAARRGDASTALASYERAEAAHPRNEAPRPHLLLNRCQVLLWVGLTAEALRTAAGAAAALRAAGREADLAECQLVLAEAAAADGQPVRAAREAEAARVMFARQARPGWALLAQLVALRAADAGGAVTGRRGGPGMPTGRELVRAAERCADALAAAGWPLAAYDARLVAARAALALGELAVADQQLARAGRARDAGALELRVRWWHTQAARRLADGDRRGALAALRAGLRLVEQAQAVLGATEMRVHVAAFGAELAAEGFNLVVGSGDPVRVLAWAERWRARALRLRPVRPPDEPELAAALAELRRITAARSIGADTGTAEVPSAARAAAAELAVVRLSRTARSPLHRPGAPPPHRATLVAALGDAVLVEYVRHHGRLLAVTIGATGCRLRDVAAPAAVTVQVEAAHFALRRLAHGFGTVQGLDRVRAAALAAGRALDAMLLDPVRAEIGDRPLVIVPTGELHSVPWGLLPGLVRRPITVAPSAAVWLRAVRAAAPPAPGGRDAVGAAGRDGTGGGPAVFVAGPGLPAARREVAELSRSYPRARLLDGAGATVPAVLSAMDGAALAHLAAHGLLRVDNPLFSALRLTDGPLTVYDLERLDAAPRTVVLPACQSGVAAVRAGDELLGLSSALLALGTRTVVATAVAVPDAATETLMRAFHAGLRRGAEPAVALAAARAAADPEDPAQLTAAAGFVCLGA
ncbi:CHAT domain-containing protein [Plantactinospora sp. CA-290183]|uniref:CHAT domain-containing protein n=1 Tax=Plantactinospora sp. CA-290183 TaxID=3240006 RepID=UPI003D918FCD